jgi:threonine dehydratase
MNPCVEFADIQEAQARLAEHLSPTPFRFSRSLSELTGARIYLKFENLQFTASFKERGALNRLLRLSPAERQRGVCAVSDGNHGLAVAYHAHRLGVPATIVMARHTPFVKVEHTQEHGATVVLQGDTLQDAYQCALQLARTEGLTFIHPYDDPSVIAGQGTIALEMLSSAPQLEILVAQIGGGGLIAGVALAAKALAPAIRTIGVQTTSHPSMVAALRGESLACQGNSVAEGIVAKSASALTREMVRATVDEIVLVGEADIERAICLLLNHEKTLTEGAGAAGLAAILSEPARYEGRDVGLILSGGNIDPRLLASVIMRELVREQRIVAVRIPIADRPGALALVTDVVAQQGGNILDIFHRKLSIQAPARSATLEVSFEAMDAHHAERIVQKLHDSGFDIGAAPQ